MSIWAIRHKRFFPACAMALMVAMVATAARAEPRRLALVIGNSLYARMPIIAPCASAANVVAGALKRAGFEVTQLANVSNGQMGSAMGGFAEAIGKSPDTIAVAYLCGYTIVFDGRVFLLPASTNLMRETDVLTQGIVSRVLINTIVRSNAPPLFLTARA